MPSAGGLSDIDPQILYSSKATRIAEYKAAIQPNQALGLAAPRFVLRIDPGPSGFVLIRKRLGRCQTLRNNTPEVPA